MILTFVPSRNDFILATIRTAIHPKTSGMKTVID